MLYVEIFYACLLWIIRRRGVYFLIIYYNCVIYRFNRNKALYVGIRAMSVLSGPRPGELPIVFKWYIELPSILVVLFCCCSYLLVGFVVRVRWLAEMVGMMM